MDFYREKLKIFTETISIRGLSRVTKTEDVLLRILWIICLFASAVVLVWQMTMLFIKISEWPISTTYGEVYETQTLPDISICNAHPLQEIQNEPFTHEMYVDRVKELMKRNPNDEKWKRKFNNSLAISKEGYETMFQYLNYNILYFANLPYERNIISDNRPNLIVGCTLFNNLYMPSWGDCSDIISNYTDTIYYRCFTLSPIENNFNYTNIGISILVYIHTKPGMLQPYLYELFRSTSEGAIVSFHNRNQKPDFYKAIYAGLGQQTTIKVTTLKRERLPKPYSKPDCYSPKFFENSTENVYSQRLCTDLCFQKLVYNRCNCISPFNYYTAELKAKYEFCGNQSCSVSGNGSLLCQNSGFDSFLCNMVVYYELFEHERKCSDCLLPCKEMACTKEVSSTPWPHPSYQWDIYERFIKSSKNEFVRKKFAWFDEMDVKRRRDNISDQELIEQLYKRDEITSSFLQINIVLENSQPYQLVDKPFYTYESILSLVGGGLSLWLGITIMTVVEIIEFFYKLSFAKKQK